MEPSVTDEPKTEQVALEGKRISDVDQIRALYHLGAFRCQVSQMRKGKLHVSPINLCDSPTVRDALIDRFNTGQTIIVEPPKR